jgi:NAD-dependent dihydropyrimidine dehydrogenase PreA subunit
VAFMSFKNGLKLMGAYLFRWVGFSTEPTLIKVGNPNTESPVLLTCNFILTVKRVLKAIKNLDCYLLIAPSNGINVWCGACGDDFHTDSVLSIIKTSGIDRLVSHRTLILPQLSAPGIDPIIIKKKSGWIAKFGPIYIKDLPEYFKNNNIKTDQQRTIRFSVKKRTEIANVYFFSLYLIFSIIYWILASFLPVLSLSLFLNSTILMIVLIYGALIILPNLPFKTGTLKVLVYELAIIGCLTALFLFSVLNMFNLIWDIVLSVLLAIIIGEDFHGLTPIYKSEVGEKTWKKGEHQMRFLFSKYKLQPYGEITIERELCIGCKVCIEVCPRNLYSFNEKDNKVDLDYRDNCINCNACVKRCLANCLTIK